MNAQTNLMHKTKAQRGVVLVVALVILLIMSIIGVSSLSTSTLQERMASNNRQRALALFAAETALRGAESWLETNVRSEQDLYTEFDGTKDGLYSSYEYNQVPGNRPSFTDPDDMTDDSEWKVTGISIPVGGLSTGLVAQDPRYTIEYIGRDTPGNKAIFSPGDVSVDRSPHIFLITAIGWGRDPNVYTILQSTFRTGSGPGPGGNDYFKY